MKFRLIITVCTLAVLLCACTQAGYPSIAPSTTPITTQSAVQTVAPTPEAQTTPSPTVDITPSPTLSASVTATGVLPEASHLYEGSVVLTPDPYGLPSESLPVCEGIVFNLRGKVTSSSPITKLTVEAIDHLGNTVIKSISFSPEDNITSLRLDEPAADQPSLDSFAPTNKLECGKCLINIYAQTSSLSDSGLIYSSRFDKLSDSNTFTLSPNNFRSYFYWTCLDLFEDESQFMFNFKQDKGRSIKHEEEWKNKNLTRIQTWQGDNVYVHKVAKPYFEQAYQYMTSTYLRVRSSYFDSGIMPLSNLATSQDGTYVSRFVSGKRFVSHHAFGTAQDINATYPSNLNNVANRKIIQDEVALLEYEGIETDENGTVYHSFLYKGECTDIRGGVPETVSNYLIYELAFFRAGFGWGLYYDHTSDAMHFSISELSPSVHESENGGLRKVYTYQ